MALVEVSQDNLSVIPARQIVLVEATFSDGSSARGTGVLVGTNDILTAGHVVYNQTKGWMKSLALWFAPNFNPTTSQLKTVGESVPWSHWTATAWPNQIYASAPSHKSTPQETQFDTALIGIDYPVGTKLGFLNLNEGFNQVGIPFEATAYGYSSGFSALTHAETTATKFGPSASMYTIREQLFGGASGGPLLTTENEVIGVVSASSPESGTQFSDLSMVWDELIEVYHQNDVLLPTWSRPSWNLTISGYEKDYLPTRAMEGQTLLITASDEHHVADRVSVNIEGISETNITDAVSFDAKLLEGSMIFGDEFVTALLLTENDGYQETRTVRINATFFDDDSGYQESISATFDVFDDSLTSGSASSQKFRDSTLEYETSILIEAAFGRSHIDQYLTSGLELRQKQGSLESTIGVIVSSGLIESRVGQSNEQWVSQVYSNIAPPLQNLASPNVFVDQLDNGVVSRLELLTLATHALMSWDGAVGLQ